MTDTGEQVRAAVRDRYAAAARSVTRNTDDQACCAPAFDGDVHDGAVVFGSALYDTKAQDASGEGVQEALAASLGCGVPTSVADLRDGDVVLDLGSGAGGDALLSAARVAPTGRVYGLDMTPEMLDLARANAERAGVTNVEFLTGYLEQVPLPDAAVDVVISNCVINLAVDKRVVLAEAARVTRPGGRFAVSDVIADVDMDQATRDDLAAYTGCIAGALTERHYRALLTETGWRDVSVEVTHRVHDQAVAAVVRAVRG